MFYIYFCGEYKFRGDNCKSLRRQEVIVPADSEGYFFSDCGNVSLRYIDPYKKYVGRMYQLKAEDIRQMSEIAGVSADFTRPGIETACLDVWRTQASMAFDLNQSAKPGEIAFRIMKDRWTLIDEVLLAGGEIARSTYEARILPGRVLEVISEMLGIRPEFSGDCVLRINFKGACCALIAEESRSHIFPSGSYRDFSLDFADVDDQAATVDEEMEKWKGVSIQPNIVVQSNPLVSRQAEPAVFNQAGPVVVDQHQAVFNQADPVVFNHANPVVSNQSDTLASHQSTTAASNQLATSTQSNPFAQARGGVLISAARATVVQPTMHVTVDPSIAARDVVIENADASQSQVFNAFSSPRSSDEFPVFNDGVRAATEFDIFAASPQQNRTTLQTEPGEYSPPSPNQLPPSGEFGADSEQNGSPEPGEKTVLGGYTKADVDRMFKQQAESITSALGGAIAAQQRTFREGVDRQDRLFSNVSDRLVTQLEQTRQKLELTIERSEENTQQKLNAFRQEFMQDFAEQSSSNLPSVAPGAPPPPVVQSKQSLAAKSKYKDVVLPIEESKTSLKVLLIIANSLLVVVILLALDITVKLDKAAGKLAPIVEGPRNSLDAERPPPPQALPGVGAPETKE